MDNDALGEHTAARTVGAGRHQRLHTRDCGGNEWRGAAQCAVCECAGVEHSGGGEHLCLLSPGK